MFNLQKVTDENKLPVKRWISLLSVTIMGSTLNMFFIFSVLVGPLNETHGWPVGEILLAYTLMTWMITPVSLIGGKFRDMFGDKAIILFGGLCYGISCILCIFVPILPAFILTMGIGVGTGVNVSTCAFTHNIGVLFPDKRGLAVGIYYGGMCMLQSIMIPAVAYIAESFSSSFALAVIGISGAVVCLIFLPMVTVPPKQYIPKGWNPGIVKDKIRMEERKVEVHWRQLLKMPAIYCIIFAFAFTTINSDAFMSNISLVSQEITGMDNMAAAWMASIFTLSSGVGSIFLGFVADKIGVFKAGMLISFITGIIVLTGVFSGMMLPVFVAIVVVVGLGMGGFQCYLPVIIMESFGEKNYGVNFGIATSPFIITALIDPQLTIKLPLNIYFLVGGMACLIAVLMYFIAEKLIQKYKMNIVYCKSVK